MEVCGEGFIALAGRSPLGFWGIPSTDGPGDRGLAAGARPEEAPQPQISAAGLQAQACASARRVMGCT
jgi:hypothetical protein